MEEEKRRKNAWAIYTLLLFGILPLLRECIADYRHETEVKPIVKGLAEIKARENHTFPGERGHIYVLSSVPEAEVRYISRLSGSLSNTQESDIPAYDISVNALDKQVIFTRDTSVGQVIAVLYDCSESGKWPDNRRILNIYFEPGTDRFRRDRRSTDIAVVYLREPQWEAVFVADTFDKDPLSPANRLARKRLAAISERFKMAKIDRLKYRSDYSGIPQQTR